MSDRRSTVARAISLCTGIQLAGYALLVPASYALARIVPFRLRMDEEIAYFEAVLGTLGFLPAGWLAAARGWLTAEVPYGRRFKVPFLRPRRRVMASDPGAPGGSVVAGADGLKWLAPEGEGREIVPGPDVKLAQA